MNLPSKWTLTSERCMQIQYYSLEFASLLEMCDQRFSFFFLIFIKVQLVATTRIHHWLPVRDKRTGTVWISIYPYHWQEKENISRHSIVCVEFFLVMEKWILTFSHIEELRQKNLVTCLGFSLESHFENTSNVSLRVTMERWLKTISKMKLLKLWKTET